MVDIELITGHHPVMMNTSSKVLTQKQIIVFWTPLAAMWILMGIEQPIINAFIARMGDMKWNLAAFGIAFSLALIIEGPIIQMLTAGTALGKDHGSYRKLIKFMHFWGAGLTLIHLLIALTPLYDFIVGGVMGAPEELMELSQRTFLMMTPWTAAIGYRRLWQGLLIRHGRTVSVPLIMVSRMVVVFGVLIVGVVMKFLPGAVLGGLALTLGVLVSGATAYLFVRPVIAELKKEDVPGDLTWTGLLQFYLPLALTLFIVLAARPIITAGLSRGEMPLESLALWPVASSFLFIFQSVPLSYQEVVVALLKCEDDRKALRKFRNKIMFIVAGIFLVVAISPLGTLWFTYVAGLNAELLALVKVPFLLCLAIPVIYALLSWYRGRNIAMKNTGVVAWATVVNILVLGAGMSLLVHYLPLPGIYLAPLGYTFSIAAEAFIMFRWGIRGTMKEVLT